MVLLTFSTLKDELLDRSKKTTIRKNVSYWTRIFWRTWAHKGESPTLDMWWLNPRNRHPDCYKMGQALLSRHDVKFGSEFTLQDALDDGFGSLEALYKALEDRNKMSIWEVREAQWIILRFTWLNGYPMKGGKS
jgi:hypothetical protein